MPLTALEMRELFPITQRYAYLNVASVAPLAGPVRAAIDVFLDRQGEEPFDEAHWWKLREQVRALVGQLLKVRPEACTFTQNTTVSLSLVAAGLEWHAGDNVVGVQGEYPANIYPWMALKERGVELRLYQPADGRIDPGGLLERCDERTRLVAVSHVQFWNGFRADLEAIGRGCRERDIFLVVDGVQAVGGLEVDAGTLPVDFLAAGAQKWLLGPLGIGLSYIGPRLFDQLRPFAVGTDSVVRDHEYFHYDLTLKPNARRFEEATPNLPGILGLGAALNLVVRAGIARIEAHVLHLAQLLREELPRRGYQLVAPPLEPSQQSGIVSFRHPRMVPEEVEARLRDARVILSQRGDFLRASAHFFNNEDDVDRLLEALPS